MLSRSSDRLDACSLQQGLANRVWGRAAPGGAVTVSIARQSHSTTAEADGRWDVRLDPISEYGGPYTLTVQRHECG